MTNPDHVHPVTSRWQRILNGRGVPPHRDQRDLAIPGPWVRAARPGRLKGNEPWSATLGAWFVEGDVERG